MLSKEEIQKLKEQDPAELARLLRETADNPTLLFLLENLGALPAGFDGEVFVPHLKNLLDKVRLWAVKNLGKAKILDQTKSAHWLDLLCAIAKEDADSLVRREAVSSIGRLRSREAIPILQGLLSDNDPKVVLQAIRGLMVFRGEPEVLVALRPLAVHPNEIIREVIGGALGGNGRSSEATSRETREPHPYVPDYLKNIVVQGDVLPVVKAIPNEVLHLTFTSPPYYNARDYSIYASYEGYLDFLEAVFAEVLRGTKEGRFLAVNTSPVIVPRVSRAHSSKRYPIPFDLHGRLTRIGWEFIDDIVWVKPETSVKNRNAGFGQHRKPLAYKPNPVTEYVMVYRKATSKLLDWNMQSYDEATIRASLVEDGYESSNVWQIGPSADKVHTAVFPLELCHRIICFYSYKGDLVFDPFGGSGTLGRATQNLERYFFMTEIEPAYIERMKQKLLQISLFGQTHTRFLTSGEFFQLNTSYKEGKNENH